MEKPNWIENHITALFDPKWQWRFPRLFPSALLVPASPSLPTDELLQPSCIPEREGIWTDFVNDVIFFLEKIENPYPSLPVRVPYASCGHGRFDFKCSPLHMLRKNTKLVRACGEWVYWPKRPSHKNGRPNFDQSRISQAKKYIKPTCPEAHIIHDDLEFSTKIRLEHFFSFIFLVLKKWRKKFSLENYNERNMVMCSNVDETIFWPIQNFPSTFRSAPTAVEAPRREVAKFWLIQNFSGTDKGFPKFHEKQHLIIKKS